MLQNCTILFSDDLLVEIWKVGFGMQLDCGIDIMVYGYVSLVSMIVVRVLEACFLQMTLWPLEIQMKLISAL